MRAATKTRFADLGSVVKGGTSDLPNHIARLAVVYEDPRIEIAELRSIQQKQEETGLPVPAPPARRGQRQGRDVRSPPRACRGQSGKISTLHNQRRSPLASPRYSQRTVATTCPGVPDAWPLFSSSSFSR